MPNMIFCLILINCVLPIFTAKRVVSRMRSYPLYIHINPCFSKMIATNHAVSIAADVKNYPVTSIAQQIS